MTRTHRGDRDAAPAGEPGGVPHRLRVVTTRDDLDLVTADLLRTTAVVVRAGVAGDGPSLPAVERLFGWLDVWRDHRSYRTGIWACVVDGAAADPEYTAYRPAPLEFHSDMSRYARPPEFTVIRCVVPAAAGGENHVLHVDDAIAELHRGGRRDIVDMLARRRSLNMDLRHRNVPAPPRDVPLAVAGEPRVPVRIFDRRAASKGQHLAMGPAELELYDEFLGMCAGMTHLVASVRLEPFDVLAFSNWRFLHARGWCAGSGRTTHIAMGDERGEAA